MILRKQIKALAAALGIERRYVRDVTGKIVGLEVRRRGVLLSGSEIVTADIDGQRISFFVMDAFDAIQKCHKRGVFYEREELAIIQSSFNGGVFVDIGANVGNHAIYGAKFLNAAKVIAFEPNPAAYVIFQINMVLNSISDRVVHHAVGLSDVPGRATFTTPGSNLGATSLDTSSGKGAFEIATGDSVLGDEHIDFIKIDTEGMELRVLNGLSQSIARSRPKIFIEVDDCNADAFRALTEKIDYRITERFRHHAVNENFLIEPVS